MVSYMFDRVEGAKSFMNLTEEADEELKLSQKQYRNDYDRLVCFDPIFLRADYICIWTSLPFPVGSEAFHIWRA